MRSTFHLVPRDVWLAADPAAPFAAPSLQGEGFIHCTDGADELLRTANRHYRDDPRDFLVLSVDLDAAGSTWRIDDPGQVYPHVFGPIDRAAILDVAPVGRDRDGAFTSVGQPASTSRAPRP
jgi:uncharacterized protein (DUF952 family)